MCHVKLRIYSRNESILVEAWCNERSKRLFVINERGAKKIRKAGIEKASVEGRRNSWEELGRERESERGKTFSLVLVAILLGASTVVATRCVHRADERLVKEHGKALLNHSRRRASLRPCYFGYHDTDTLFHQISLRAYINFPLTSLASSWWRAKVEFAGRDIRPIPAVRCRRKNWSFAA